MTHLFKVSYDNHYAILHGRMHYVTSTDESAELARKGDTLEISSDPGIYAPIPVTKAKVTHVEQLRASEDNPDAVLHVISFKCVESLHYQISSAFLISAVRSAVTANGWSIVSRNNNSNTWADLARTLKKKFRRVGIDVTGVANSKKK